MKPIILLFLVCFTLVSCYAQKNVIKKNSKIIRMDCNDEFVYYEDNNERLILGKDDDSVVGRFILSDEIDIHDFISQGCLNKCDSNKLVYDNYILKTYCPGKVKYILLDILSYNEDLSNSENKVYEIRYMCCKMNDVNHRVYYLRLKKEGDKFVFKSFKLESNDL